MRMDNKWFIVLLFSVFFIGGFLGGFFEGEKPIQKVLIDEYFDEKINETIYVYCINDNVYYNITNHDLNSTIVCYFNHSLGYCSVEENCGYNEYSPIHCYKVKIRD